VTAKKPEKIDPEIRVKRRNLKDLIRDEIYGAYAEEARSMSFGDEPVICIRTKDVAKIAKRIAKRAMIGPG
jgi:hypothetical protein